MRGFVIPKCLSCIGVAPIPDQLTGSMSRAIAQALWAKPGERRSGTVLIGLFGSAHCTHPTITGPLRRLMATARALRSTGTMRNLMLKCLSLTAAVTRHHGGPRGAMKSVSKAYQIRFRRDGLLHLGRMKLDPTNEYHFRMMPHILREKTREKLWKNAAAQRKTVRHGRNDLVGIEKGVDLKTVRLVYDKLDTRWQGVLRYVMTGAFHPPVPRLEDGTWARVCLYCGNPNPNLEHVYWHCPHWQAIRNRRRIPQLDQYPPCFRNCGIPSPGTREDHVVKVQTTMAEIFQAVLADLESIPEKWRWLPRPTTMYAHEAPRIRPHVPEDDKVEEEMAQLGDILNVLDDAVYA